MDRGLKSAASSGGAAQFIVRGGLTMASPDALTWRPAGPRPRFLAVLGMTHHPLCHSEESFGGRTTRNLVGWPGFALSQGRSGGVA